MKRKHFITALLFLSALFAFAACEDDVTGEAPIFSESCGDGILDDYEECDDGNLEGGDGCSDRCQIEKGWKCEIPGEPCQLLDKNEEDEDKEKEEPNPSLCGNRVIDKGETCDDGNAISGDGCSADCQVEPYWICPNPGYPCKPAQVCGNGMIEGDEECDDGNTNSGDGCSAECTLEEGYSCPYEGQPCAAHACGNGILDPGEECDNGRLGNVNLYGGGCMENCTFSGTCGDGEVQHGFEVCDDGVNDGSYGSCLADCSNFAAFCGDGLRTHHEQCDDGNLVDGDGCSANCTVEEGWTCPIQGPCIKILCGNGILDPGEECDDGNRKDGDGCNEICLVEKGWKCPDANKPCEPVVCGDSIIDEEGGENCDDGNNVSGDGCDEFCRVEPGWICPLPGIPCYARTCGDGIIARGEECDDGNNVSGDGCSDRCQIEEGWRCETPGQPCTQGKCGDGKLDKGETCDTGNIQSPGCVDCQLQNGWKCDIPGQDCQPIQCGDGKIEGNEECDDGNTNNGDGCSSQCKLETGWRCEAPNKPCVKGECGDGFIDAGEECDDGNNTAGDGCSPLCEIEAIFDCRDGVCKPVCGDGITVWEAGEECDDGNLISGDGCDSQCRIEEGFACTDFSAPNPATIELPITYRDFIRYHHTPAGPGDGFLTQEHINALPNECKTFSGYRPQYFPTVNKPHPDFNSYCPDARCENVVFEDLDTDGKPALAPPEQFRTVNAPSGQNCTFYYTCPTMFKWWYTDIPGVNRRIDSKLTLTRDPNNPGQYSYSNSSFYPINGLGYGNATSNGSVNGEFSSEFQTYFKYEGGETLTFNGDDDVWVFFNGKLGVDVGGIHPAWQKSITLDNATAASRFKMFPGGIYPLQMFHAERCTGGSSFQLTLSGFLNMGQSQCNAVCGDGLVRGDEECDAGADNGKPESGCSVDCKIVAYCGNGIVEYPEACDDGPDNGKPGKCPAGCVYPGCNNGKLDEGEECDPSVPSSIPAGMYCLNTCQFSRCGDGFVDERLGEECDDGNESNDDMCTNECKRPYCGDGIVSPHIGEVCDDGINDGSYGGCGLGCSYIPPRCGDGVVDSLNGEECDDGINNGHYNTCNPDCTLASRCGDGIIDTEYGEQCDDGNQVSGDGCSQHCRIELN